MAKFKIFFSWPLFIIPLLGNAGSLNAPFFRGRMCVLLSANHVQVYTKSQTKYTAPFLISDNGPVIGSLTASIPLADARADGDYRPLFAESDEYFSKADLMAFLYTCEPPARWFEHRGVDYHSIANNMRIMSKAAFHPAASHVAPYEKTVIEPKEYCAEAKDTSIFNYAELGLKISMEFGYELLDNLNVYCLASFACSPGQQGCGNTKDISLFAYSSAVTLTGSLATPAYNRKGLSLLPFQWSKNCLMKDVTLNVSVKEQFSVGVGVDAVSSSGLWKVGGEFGVRQFDVMSEYAGGVYAFPFSACYSPAYLQRYSLWKEGPASKLSFSNKTWTLFGGIWLSYMKTKRLSFSAGVDYAHFSKRLSKVGGYYDGSLSNPTAPPGDEQDFSDGALFHMGVASNVSNHLTSVVYATQLVLSLSLAWVL